uniref:(northern house mosquito) hypothetical protein n=1 Tax=Culex pipiens TaxID=7175 RepID=A0A8D8BUE2_CULPI
MPTQVPSSSGWRPSIIATRTLAAGWNSTGLIWRNRWAYLEYSNRTTIIVVVVLIVVTVALTANPYPPPRRRCRPRPRVASRPRPPPQPTRPYSNIAIPIRRWKQS